MAQPAVAAGAAQADGTFVMELAAATQAISQAQTARGGALRACIMGMAPTEAPKGD